MKLGGAVMGHEIDLPTLAGGWEAALAGVQALGKAQAGEKTMVDALAPAVVALRGSADRGDDLAAALAGACRAAEAGKTATIPMLATKGRASYLGERSIGHQDAGATSCALLWTTLAQAVAEGEKAIPFPSSA
jgi:dihydroxyacetone kinase-like protein